MRVGGVFGTCGEMKTETRGHPKDLFALLFSPLF
jgi:hypothetical protein